MTQATRPRVYEAIDTERTYQKLKWGENEKSEVGSFLTFMRHHLRVAEELASVMPVDSDAALHSIRKVAALGVACLEQHGAPLRDLDSGRLPVK